MQDSTLNQNTNPTFPTDQSMTTPPSDKPQSASVLDAASNQPAGINPTFPTETPPETTSNGGGVPPDSRISTPPQTDFAPPSPRRRALIPTILGLVLLVAGVGAGLVLTQQQQLIKQKASECSDYCAGADQCSSQGGHTVGSRCSGGSCSTGTSPCLIPAAVTATPTPSGPFCTGTSNRGQCPASWTWAPPGSAGAAACAGSSLGRCCQPGDNACTPPTSTTAPTTGTGAGTGTIGDSCTTNADCGKSGSVQLGCGQCDSGKKCGDWTNGWIYQADGTKVNAACVSPGTHPTQTVAACGGAYLLSVDCSGCPTGKGKTCFTSGWSQCFNADACGFVCTSYTTKDLCNSSPGCSWTGSSCTTSGATTTTGSGSNFLGCGNVVAGGNGDQCSNCYNIGGKVTCLREGSSCGANVACFSSTTPTTPPTTTTPNTPPGSTAPSTAQCQAVKAYDTNWNLLTTTQLSALKAGDKVRFTVTGTTTSGVFDKARFTVNGTLRSEVTTTKPAATQEFYDEYTIPVGVTSFTVTAQIHHAALNTWN